MMMMKLSLRLHDLVRRVRWCTVNEVGPSTICGSVAASGHVASDCKQVDNVGDYTRVRLPSTVKPVPKRHSYTLVQKLHYMMFCFPSVIVIGFKHTCIRWHDVCRT